MIPFTQTKEYLKWHEAVGTKTVYRDFFEKLEDEGDAVDFLIDGEKQKEKIATFAGVFLDLKIGRVLYIPYGPYFYRAPNKKEQRQIEKEIFEIGKYENCVFVRLENEHKYLKNIKKLVRPPKRTYASIGIFQPRMEWWLDISGSVDEILANMHKDHRYSIRRAQKEGVEVLLVKENLLEYFPEFWKLMETTAERDGFILYDKKYYEQIFQHNHHELKKFAVFTKIEGVFTSVALVVISHGVANLVFAGSISERRELGYNHLMQWEAIRESKNHNCSIYNFGGINENGYGKETLSGVTGFKKKFGGFGKFHGKFYDMPIKKIRYLAYLVYKMVK